MSLDFSSHGMLMHDLQIFNAIISLQIIDNDQH